ncbi:MAG: SpoIIE family protein phosphatase, partial [Bacteroidota bacterium]
EEILELSRQQGDSVSTAVALNNLGYGLRFLGRYKESEKLFRDALRLQKRIKRPEIENALVWMNIGIVQQNQGKYEEALESLRLATSILESENDKKTLAQAYQLLSSVYFNAGDFYNARIFNDKAEALAKETTQNELLTDAYQLSSLIYQEQADYQEALEAYKDFLDLRDSLTLAAQLQQQRLLQEQQTLERSEERLKLLFADQEVQELEAKRQQLELEKQASELEVLRRDQALQKAELERQELAQKQSRQQLLLTRNQLEAERQKRAIQELREREEIQAAELEKKRLVEARQKQELELAEEQRKSLEKDKALSDLALESEREQKQFLFGIIALGILLTILIAFVLWNTRRKNKQLAEQKNEIEEQNQELAQLNEEMTQQKQALAMANESLNTAYIQITDSVRYAQRIQDSIMVEPKSALHHFEDGFIFFKPRDIVSGDFYWFSDEHDPRVVLAAVDCTGHGVPGAFMSLIGNDLLNGLVNIGGVTDPAEILTQLSAQVSKTLQQDRTDNRDGMDMSLIVLDKEKQTLEFAGAKNPLLVIQEGERKKIKGSRSSIGGDKRKPDPYVTHTFPLNPEGENYFYIFSDGFQDQFGGKDGRKYMTKRFYALLESIHSLPMDEQHKRLEKEFKSWLKNEKQIDDVLVIGIKA